MKQKMNIKQPKAGIQMQESRIRLMHHFNKTFVGLLMMAILLTSPFLSHATLLYMWKDTCCVAKNFNSVRYAGLVKITTPDQADFLKADREIRRNLFSDILNEGKISTMPFQESDHEINKNFKNEYQIDLITSAQSDDDIHDDFTIAHLNWKFEVKESDKEIILLFYNQGSISVPSESGKISDEIIHWDFLAQHLQTVSHQQIQEADADISNALIQGLSENEQ